SEKLVDACANMFAMLTKDGYLLYYVARAMILACALDGEYYTAVNEENELVGFCLWMPPGKVIFSTWVPRHILIITRSQLTKTTVCILYLTEFPKFVAGCLGKSNWKDDFWFLHTLMVRPENQRQGVGRALMQPVRERVRISFTFEPIALSTTNQNNVPIYTSLGLRLLGSRVLPSPWGDWQLFVFSLDPQSAALLGEHSAENEDGKAPCSTKFQPPFNVPRWLLLTCCALATLDIVVYVYVARLLLSIPGQSYAGEIQMRNQYVGLDELYTSQPPLVNTSRYGPIMNMPRLSVQVSSAQPNKVTLEDQHRHLTNIGTLSPPDRHLQVSHNTHTVLQFRTMDFGMERCALVLRLPIVGESDASSANTTTLDICTLDAPRLLDPRVLSWETRPRCQKHMGTLVGRPGREVQLPDFPCPWGSLHTYEVACASDAPECNIDVWSNQHEPWGTF
ncbi:hypothetical protein JB92DRAFT_2758829, partial [Gautieria morchelliformis]